ncbi:MAG: hypothetical protein ACTSW1_08355 [Candidatus Hodarchaeales archaeon]
MIQKINALADYIVENAWEDTIHIHHGIYSIYSGDVSLNFGDVDCKVYRDLHRNIDIKFDLDSDERFISKQDVQRILDQCRKLFDVEMEKRRAPIPGFEFVEKALDNINIKEEKINV